MAEETEVIDAEKIGLELDAQLQEMTSPIDKSKEEVVEEPQAEVEPEGDATPPESVYSDEDRQAVPEGDEGESTPLAIDPALRDRGRQFGFTDEDMDAVGTDAGVESMLRVMTDRFTQVSDQTQTQTPVPDQEPQVHNMAEMPQEPALDFTALTEEFGPELGERLQEMNQYHESRITAMQGQLDQVLRHHQDTQSRETEAWMDSQFETLGKDYEGIIGKGPSRGMDMRTNEYKNRLNAFEMMNAIAGGMEQQGRAVPDRAILFQQAIRSTLGEHMEARSREKIRGKVVSRNGQSIARPTQREVSRDISSTDDAAAAYETKMRDLGF